MEVLEIGVEIWPKLLCFVVPRIYGHISGEQIGIFSILHASWEPV